MNVVRARFSKGALIPMDNLDLEEGAEVMVTVKRSPPMPEEARRALRMSAGAWKGKHDPDELIRNIYESRLTGSRVEPEL